MKRQLTLSMCALLIAACEQDTAIAQPTALQPSDILAEATGKNDQFLPDFSYAGYGFGLEPLPTAEGTVIDPGEFGAVPDDGKDDSAAIKAALQKARETDGAVIIRFAPGQYQLTEILNLNRSNLVIQGAGRGAEGTEILMPRPLAMVDTGDRFNELREYLVKYTKRQREPENNLDVLFSEYSWTGGFFWVGKTGARAVPYLEELDERSTPLTLASQGERGGLTIEVDDSSAITEGDWIEIQWYSDRPESGIIQSIYGDTELKIGSHHWNFVNRSLVRHRTKVIDVGGNQLSVASPLPHPIGPEIPAEIVAWQPLERIGIEDLSLTFPNAAVFGHHVERGYNGVYFTGAADSWIRNVTITNPDAGILTDDSAHLTFSDLKFEGQRRAHYAVHMGSVENVLAQNMEIDVPIIHSLTFNTKSLRCVYKDAVVHHEPVLDQHAGSNHQNLFDNITLHLTAGPGSSGPAYKVFDGSGAPYWQPGHGRYNTTWNLKLIVEGGMPAGETLEVLGIAEGPDARIVGLHSNRPVTLDYRPEPLIARLGERIDSIPSLYDYQLLQRRHAE
ncbi:MAG: glycosyl hydrolase family 28-related protein [Pseudomonadota bacterium]